MGIGRRPHHRPRGPQWLGQEMLSRTCRATQKRRKILWAFGWRPALQEGEVADAPTLEPIMLNNAPLPAQAAIRTDLGAIFVSMSIGVEVWFFRGFGAGR